MSDDQHELDPHQPLKPLPAYGCFLYWPSSGEDWIEARDRLKVKQLIPSGRVFLRHPEMEDGWNQYLYGRIVFRANPVGWFPVQQPDFERGDHVEIKSELNQRRSAIAVIREILWNASRRQLEYQLVIAGSRQPRHYTTGELQLVPPLGEKIPTSRRGLPLRFGGYQYTRAIDSSAVDQDE